ncbi:MAG: hypothetical protein FWG10_06775 [Eubacteriaceae bacterium]|nr:hypothetical protein [Eubacteriaceae bacterium]
MLAIQCSNNGDGNFAVFCKDKRLYYGNEASGFDSITVIENIGVRNHPIKIYCHHPYICVSEQYGLNAAVINVNEGVASKLARKDSQNGVSSYSIGFLECSGRTLLLYQTQYNRLDIIDLSTWQLITPRSVYYGWTGEMYFNGRRLRKRIAGVNYINYRHSLLSISPDSKSFLSNGWGVPPEDNILFFETSLFLKDFEPSRKLLGYSGREVWDRPCTFVGNDMFVIAADAFAIDSSLEFSDISHESIHQLLFYKISEVKSGIFAKSISTGLGAQLATCSKNIPCDVFTYNSYGQITGGELHFDHESGHLIALSEKGAFELSLDGETISSDYSIRLNKNTSAIRGIYKWGSRPRLLNWQYDATNRVFYRFYNGIIEKRAFGSKRLDADTIWKNIH